MKAEFETKRSALANDFADAGAALLVYMGTDAALAAIPETNPQQYAVAGTLAMIAKVLPAAPVPPLTAPAPLTDDVARKALQRIARWHGEFPATGKTWEGSGNPMSYSACYGSNGERDYMRQVALDALAKMDEAAPAPQQSEGLSNEQIIDLMLAADNRAYEVPVGVLVNGGRAIEREVANKAAPAAPVQTAVRAEVVERFVDYSNIAHLIGSIFFAGDFKAETANERELEALLVKTGHRYASWDEIIAFRDDDLPIEFSLAAPVQAEQAQAEPIVFEDFPDFNEQAMGCGLEDRNITDRYEAMRYGFEEALDLVDERIKNFLADLAAPALPAQAEQAAAVRAAYEKAAQKIEGLPCSRDDHQHLLRAAEAVRALAKEAAIEAPSQPHDSAERRCAPWPDFKGNPIHEGDTIEHPTGARATVVVYDGEEDPGDQWRADYGDGLPSRLVLQIGDKGRAVVVPQHSAQGDTGGDE